MNTDKISIIIPIFNAQDYIDTCLESLVTQTYGIENIEILCINDCTPDKSMDIVQTYKKRFPNSIKIINHKKNKGPGGARNTGLANATGAYITFADPDDYLDTNAYKYILTKMQKDDIQLACFNFDFFTNSGEKLIRPRPFDSLFTEEIEISHDILLSKYPEFIHSMSVWNKIYKRKLLQNITPFPKNQLFNEDARFSTECFLNASKILFSDKIFYHYRRNHSKNTATNKMYDVKESYGFHLTHLKYLNAFKSKYPQLSNEIGTLSINNWYQFIHNIIINSNPHFTTKEQLYYFKETKRLFTNVKISKCPKGVYPHPKALFLAFKISPSFFVVKIIYKLLYKLSTLKKYL